MDNNKQVNNVSEDETTSAPKIEVPVEQIRYANLLYYCSMAGIAILVITFLLYLTGIMSSYIPPSEISQYWSLPLKEYLAATGAPTGWGWIHMLNKSDYLTFVGIVLLGAVTIIGYLFFLLPAYLRKKDAVYLTIVIIEIIVLLLAASGLVEFGGA